MIKVFSIVTRFTKIVLGGGWGCGGGRVSGRVVSDEAAGRVGEGRIFSSL